MFRIFVLKYKSKSNTVHFCYLNISYHSKKNYEWYSNRNVSMEHIICIVIFIKKKLIHFLVLVK